MADVIVLVNGVSSPIKLAWMLWFAWGLVQIGWYRRSRVTAPAAVPVPLARPERPPRPPRRQHPDPVEAAFSSRPDVAATSAGISPHSDSLEGPAPFESEEPPPRATE